MFLLRNPMYRSLAGLFFLSFLGGVFFSSTGRFLRHWGADNGIDKSTLDWIAFLGIVTTLRMFWASALSWPWSFIQRCGISIRRFWVIVLVCSIGILQLIMPTVTLFGAGFLIMVTLLKLLRTSFDMLMIASQMDAVEKNQWAWSDNVCMNGYNLGITLSGSLGLYINSMGVEWPYIYTVLGITTLSIGLIIFCFPVFSFLEKAQVPTKKIVLWTQVREWAKTPEFLCFLGIMITYRLQDSLINPQRDFFFLSCGFSKVELAGYIWWMKCAEFLGGIIVPFMVKRYSIHTALPLALGFNTFSGAMLWYASIYAQSYAPYFLLCENLTKGALSITLYSFQLMSCVQSKAVLQLAIVTSISNAGCHFFSSRSGWIVSQTNYSTLFLIALIGNVLPYTFIYYYRRIRKNNAHNSMQNS